MLKQIFITPLILLLSACSQAQAQNGPPKIVIDQFGYLPNLEKRAVIRDPQMGYDADESFTPSDQYAVVNARTGEVVYEGKPIPWARGKVDEMSGDRVWIFDFTPVTTPGSYVIRDLDKGMDSYPFEISDTVYNQVFRTAVKSIYLQRANFEKTARFAGPWADKASHTQDAQATLYSRKGDMSTARDLRGGWYDAGDYNQYTSWTANYISILLMSYLENPTVWRDDFDIPESGNGVPDILDEVKWGLDWLERMQNADGSMLSVLGRAEASPPSKADGPSYYGPPNTSATVTAAGAFAIAAKVYRDQPKFAEDAKRYQSRALKAWEWAEANPNVIFKNNDEGQGSEGLAAGQQEVDAKRLNKKRLIANSYLYAMSNDPKFAKNISRLYVRVRPMAADTANGFEGELSFTLLYFAHQPGVDARLRAAIQRDYTAKVLNAHNGYPAVADYADPYGSYVDGYWWGSNGTKSRRGSVHTQAALHSLGDETRLSYLNAGSHYLHYIHGVNPLNKVYLSNMRQSGAENSVNSFYHAWFKDGSKLYDDVRTSKYGPAPGFLVGGANDSYERDACCASQCGGYGDKMCRMPVNSPPTGQPPAKSYADFNEGWPINSWSVTENSLGYQVDYIRLLSKYAK